MTTNYSITEALEATKKMRWYDGGYISAKVEVTESRSGKAEIECGIYANAQWGTGPTFEAALAALNAENGETSSPITGEVIANV